MRTRSISAIGVVLVGIIPALFGGPVWALTFALICMIAFIEFHGLASHFSPRIPKIGILLIPCFAAAAWTNHQERLAMGLVALSVFLPIMGTVRRKNLAGSVTDWALGAAGALYLRRRCLLRDPDSLDGRHGLSQMADRSRFEPVHCLAQRSARSRMVARRDPLHLVVRHLRLSCWQQSRPAQALAGCQSQQIEGRLSRRPTRGARQPGRSPFGFSVWPAPGPVFGVCYSARSSRGLACMAIWPSPCSSVMPGSKTAAI